MAEYNIIPVVAGATASGKSSLLYSLCDKGLTFELISADAFQVYKGLDIGTAKPSAELRKNVRHHLIDVVPPDGKYDAGDFVGQAELAIREAVERGVLPIVSGGTGLYIQSLAEGLFDSPPSDHSLRKLLREREINEGSGTLFKELAEVDPQYAAKIHPNDLLRTVRALEVWYTMGIPVTKAHKEHRREPSYKYMVMALDRDRDELYDRVDLRVSHMLENGWLSEVKNLLDKGITVDMPSFRALGYRELAGVINGDLTLESAEEIIARKTRNYAKRQMTWFRGMKDVVFLNEHKLAKRLLEGWS